MANPCHTPMALGPYAYGIGAMGSGEAGIGSGMFDSIREEAPQRQGMLLISQSFPNGIPMLLH
jgi:hypothetical protein